MKIRTKIVTMMLAASSVPVAVIGALGIRESTAVVYKQAGSDSLEQAGLISNLINQQLHSYLDLAKTMANVCQRSEGDAGHVHATRARILADALEATEGLAYLAIADRAGTVIVASSPDILGKRLPANSRFDQILAGGAPVIGALAHDPLVGKQTLHISVPMTEADDGDDAAVLSVALQWADVSRVIRSLPLGGREQSKSDHIMVMDREGFVIVEYYFKEEELFKENLVSVGMQSARLATEGKTGWLIERDEHGQQSLATYRRMGSYADLPDTGWSIILLQNSDRVFAASSVLRGTIIRALLGIGLACGVASLILARRVTRPLIAMTAAVRRFAQEELEVPIAAGSGDEIGILARAFEQMRQNIRQRNQELRQFNETLQEQVRQRTAELEKAVHDAKTATRIKSEFLANMSHEIRTPITAILGYADLLQDISQPQDERQNCVQTIRRNGEHLLSVINDILDLSKIESGRMTVETIDCSPCQIVAEVAMLMRVRAVDKGLRLNVEYVFPVPERVKSDPIRLRQILVNLVGNAIKFTASGGVRILVRFSKSANDQHWMRFEVIDTGVGMTQEQVGRLYQPFTQADSSTTRRYGGTGLGLAISRHMVELMGGSIEVQSIPDRGTSFIVTMPAGRVAGARMIENAREALAVVESAAPAQTTTQHLHGRVLLAEDGLDNQRLISFLLRKYGLEVGLAENGRVAVDMIQQARDAGRDYDLILMDMQMPELDGYAATRELRRAGYTQPIIALTAHAMSGDREKCLNAGCNDYTTKPIDRDELFTMIRSYLPAPAVGGSERAAFCHKEAQNPQK